MSLLVAVVVLAIIVVVAVVASGRAPWLPDVLEAVLYLVAIVWLLKQLGVF